VGAERAGGLEVDFLAGVLADVGDPEVTRGAVEGALEGVAQAERPDLGECAGDGEVGVGGRDPVVAVGVGGEVVARDVEAEDLALGRGEVLGGVVGVGDEAVPAIARGRRPSARSPCG
jgi:hypothetical protein